jgi:hypothetical protein
MLRSCCSVRQPVSAGTGAAVCTPAGRQGYTAAGQYETALDNIRWATDYLMRCVGDGSQIVAQVGNGQQDHGEPRAAGSTARGTHRTQPPLPRFMQGPFLGPFQLWQSCATDGCVPIKQPLPCQPALPLVSSHNSLPPRHRPHFQAHGCGQRTRPA